MRKRKDRGWGFSTGGWAAVMLVAMAAQGCGGESPYEIVPVTGKVTYKDGSLIVARRIDVIFVPQTPPLDSKTNPRPGRTMLDVKTGEFRPMTTLKYADGATIGKNKVQILAVDDDQRPSTAIPQVYTDPLTTPLEVDVGPQTHFDLSIEKP